MSKSVSRESGAIQVIGEHTLQVIAKIAILNQNVTAVSAPEASLTISCASDILQRIIVAKIGAKAVPIVI